MKEEYKKVSNNTYYESKYDDQEEEDPANKSEMLSWVRHFGKVYEGKSLEQDKISIRNVNDI